MLSVFFIGVLAGQPASAPAPDLLSRFEEATALAAKAPERALEKLGPLPAETCLAAEQDQIRADVVGLAAQLSQKADPKRAAALFDQIGTSEAGEAALALEDTPLRRSRLLERHAGSPEAQRLLEAMRPKKALSLFSGTSRKLDLARAWLDAHDNEAALGLARELRGAVGKAGLERCRWGYIVGKAERKRRRYSAALAELRRTRSICASAKGGKARALDVALLEARVLAIKGRADSLEKLVGWMRALAPGHSYLDDALLWAAEARRGARSRKLLKAVVDEKGDMAPEAAWRLAREAWPRTPKQARVWLDAVLASKSAGVDAHERARFYLGRLEARTSTAAAAVHWRELAERPSFYGFLALDRLRRRAPAAFEPARAGLRRAAAGSAAPELPSRLAQHPAVAEARSWASRGDRGRDWARTRLMGAACALPDRTLPETVALAQLLAEVGAHPEAQRLLRWHPGRPLEAPLTAETAPLWRLAYSRAYAEPIAEAAEAETLDPLFLTALAREESTFDPNIVSWAGATGLAQLMPPTAIGAYASVFGGRLDLGRLTDPGLNLRLGARVLKEGLDAFGHRAFALSAYNGGAGLTRRTLPARRIPFEDWAESNPVRENRGYVKRVLSTWMTYRLLYADEIPKLPATIGPGRTVTF
ncbi:MAG: transglycosylase SLT domain-containing protein [Myxococcota bacterium]